MKKKGMKALTIMLAGMGVFCILAGRPAYGLETEAAAVDMADDASAQSGSLMKTTEDVDVKAEPDAGAETLWTYEKDVPVFAARETGEGWYLVIYQDEEGYVPKASLCPLEMNVEELDEEMEETQQEAKFVVESVEKYREDARRSKIWIGVIVLLAAGIFVIGIIAGIRSGKAEKS